MITIYGNLPQRVVRCLWALEELGMPYEQVSVPDKSNDAFRALNPAGKTPVLVDDDFVLTESCAINAYLSARSGGALMPDDIRGRARVEQWTDWAITEVEFHFTVMVREMRRAAGAGENPDQAVITSCLSQVSDTVALLEAHLAKGHDYVAGEAFSIGDINVCFPVAGIAGQIDMAPFPHVANWIARCQGRDAWQRVQSADESGLREI
ncbi:glutathione S-transferase family protein [Croceicoccus sp. YJ47]|uniref:glutathione S-transferase family protein n=1 Tax=Croceicoccus sp. YJ47 TaxID=2798724 RepID=UPI0019245102|nr:glutathione S-transferase family protein [Croceicoccus sp. YJ47]QQN75317.1 glutathione S-transferase family protein [Croceicoccus sp. YJ47]